MQTHKRARDVCIQLNEVSPSRHTCEFTSQAPVIVMSSLVHPELSFQTEKSCDTTHR